MKKIEKLIRAIVPKKIKSALKQLAKRHDTGNNVQCTICLAEHANFAPYGPSKRKNARCLSCGSGERHRLLWQFMKDKTDVFSGQERRLLHFAPEKCFFDKLIS